jgi:hypothetical protein
MSLAKKAQSLSSELLELISKFRNLSVEVFAQVKEDVSDAAIGRGNDPGFFAKEADELNKMAAELTKVWLNPATICLP